MHGMKFLSIIKTNKLNCARDVPIASNHLSEEVWVWLGSLSLKWYTMKLQAFLKITKILSLLFPYCMICDDWNVTSCSSTNIYYNTTNGNTKRRVVNGKFLQYSVTDNNFIVLEEFKVKIILHFNATPTCTLFKSN